MHRMTGLAAAAAATLVLGIGIGWMLSSGGEPAPAAPEAKIAERELVTGTVASRPAAPPQVAQPPSFPQPSAPTAAPARPAAAMMAGAPAKAAANGRCENPDALGIYRTVEIDTTGGPGFGADQFKAHDFLEPGEVVLTFDDGPWPSNTAAVLTALAAQCLKATFFPIGQHVSWHPDILRQVVAKDHTIGSHSWSHVESRQEIRSPKPRMKSRTASALWRLPPDVRWRRFSGSRDLSQTPELTAYLAERNIGIFSIDIDSFDFKLKNPEQGDHVGDDQARRSAARASS